MDEWKDVDGLHIADRNERGNVQRAVYVEAFWLGASSLSGL